MTITESQKPKVFINKFRRIPNEVVVTINANRFCEVNQERAHTVPLNKSSMLYQQLWREV